MTTRKQLREVRNASIVCLIWHAVVLSACFCAGGCHGPIQQPTPPPGEHSVLVLPPDVEKRIAELEAADKRKSEILKTALEVAQGQQKNAETMERELVRIGARLTTLENKPAAKPPCKKGTK